MKFTENSRVKIPSILHLTRLGYKYLSLKDAVWDEETNIFIDIFKQSIAKINDEHEEDDIERLLADVKQTLENEDLGKVFYGMLTQRGDILLSVRAPVGTMNITDNDYCIGRGLAVLNSKTSL